MAITKIEIRSDGLWYRDGCCDWYKVGTIPGVTASIPLSFAGKNAKELGLTEWEELGEPEIPNVPAVEHENPNYNTEDSIRCAKATAMAELLRETLDKIDDALVILIGASVSSPAEVAAALTAAGLSGGWSVVAAIAFAIAAAIVSTDLAAMDDEIDGWTSDDQLWKDYICTLTGALYPGETIETIDVQQMIKYFQVAIGFPDGTHWIRDILRTFPMFWWKELAQQDVATTDCACDQYLPHGYTPPAAAGAINFSRFMGIGGTLPAPTYPTGEPFDQFDNLPQLGSRIGATGFKTQFRGLNSTTYHQAFAILLYSEEVITLQAVKMTVDAVNSPGTGQLKMNVKVYDAQGWQASGGGNLVVNNTNDQTLEITGLNNVGNYIYIALEGLVVSASTHYEQVPDILFTGQVGGLGFLERGIGQALVP